MQSEIDSLRQRITELEAEKAELEAKNSELLKRVIEETTKYKAENDELRVRIEELEKNKTDTAKLVSENVELRDRVTKVEQRQLQNDNSPNNGLSNFNSVAENHEKLLEDKEMDDCLLKQTPVDIPDSVIAQLEQCEPVCKINDAVSKVTVSSKTSEERGMDAFLDNVNKKKVSDEIRQRKREEKLQRESIAQDLVIASSSCISEKDDRMISEISEEFEKTVPSGNDHSHVTSVEPDLKVSVEQDDELIPEESLDKNQIVEQGLIQELSFDACSSISTENNVSSTDTNSSCNGSENMISGSAQHLSYLFDTAIKSGQQEILDWYNYSLEFESKVDALTADGRIKDKTARSMIYKEMKPFLPKITQDNLRKKTLRARKHLMLFGKNGVGIDKIKLVSYSATEISKLTYLQIQNVIDQVILKTVSLGND